jgi:hypothetical protein
MSSHTWAARTLSINWSSDFTEFYDASGSVLSQANASINQDGAVVQLGYFSQSVADNLFAGEWIPLTWATSIGDTKDLTGYGDGTFSFTVHFKEGSKYVQVFGENDIGGYKTEAAHEITDGKPLGNKQEQHTLTVDATSAKGDNYVVTLGIGGTDHVITTEAVTDSDSEGVAKALAQEINAKGLFVSATVSGTEITLKSNITGANGDFTVTPTVPLAGANLTTTETQEGAGGTFLAMRFFNGSAGSATHYNTISRPLWQWTELSDLSFQSLELFVDDALLNLQFEASTSNFVTSIAISSWDYGKSTVDDISWNYLPWLGYYYQDSSTSWIYHLDHGWLYRVGSLPGDVWFYDQSGLGWIWSNADAYPYMYSANESGWLWLDAADAARKFYHFGTSQWKTHNLSGG